MTEFGVNNYKSAFTKLFLFFGTKDLHPRMSFYIIDFFNTGSRERIIQQKTLDISKNMQITYKFAWKVTIVV